VAVAFTHLEVHSHFTLLGGTASVTELAARAATDGMSHLALTDTNALYGAVAFGRACRERRVQPIIGMTMTVSAPTPPLPRTGSGEVGAAQSGQLVLLATDPDGYRSLCRLSSLIQGNPEREMLAVRGLSWEEIQAHREGLICLSGGRQGWIERYLRAGDLAAAQVYAGRLAGIFDDQAYLSLEIRSEADRSIAGEVVALGRRLGMPAVAVQPIYCLMPEDAPRLRLLAAIRENRPLGNPAAHEEEEEETQLEPDERAQAPGVQTSPPKVAAAPALEVWSRPVSGASDGLTGEAELHWLNSADLALRFAGFPEAIAETARIAARCGDVLPSGKPIWPALKLPAGETPDEALAELATAGLRARYGQESGIGDQESGISDPPSASRNPATLRSEDNSPQSAISPQLPASSFQQSAASRLAHELAAIASHGYAPLFLVVADAVRFAREHGIPVSTRGSVANSLVAYCTGITTVDPLEHGLLFERFLNPARANPPDIDLDFCSRRRDEVLRHLRDAYGAKHVALVGTVSTMRLQSAIRETGKAYGLDEATIGRLAALAPHHWHPDPRRRDKRTMDDVLAEIADPRQREVVRKAYTLVGQPDHLSVHPGGAVITPGPLTDFVPVQWAPKGFLITQFEHGDVEAIGLPKIDLLGIRALTVLSDTAEAVGLTHPGFRVDQIPLDDPATGDILMRGDTIGVFQCESDGAQRTLRKLRAHTVRDLAIANAFFKPGPAMGGMADAFVRRYRGQEPVRYLHPALEPILRDTKGVLIFQEQVLRVACEVAGLDWGQADQLRRGMGHFGADEMAALREQFVEGCLRPLPDGPGLPPAQAATLWEQVMAFAGYGFNQGHATAYADVSYRSAYLKAHYPAEFLCARLADYGGFHHPAIYMAEAIRLGIAVRPPHVNYSGEAFTLTIDDRQWTMNCDQPSSIVYRPSSVLWMGLGQVRDLRRSAVAAITAERARAPFRGAADLLGRVDLQAKETMHLIQCGALDGLGRARADLLAKAEELRRSMRKGRGKAQPLQLALPFEESATISKTPISMSEPLPAAVPPELLPQYLAWETHILGLPVSALADPLALVADGLPEHLPLRRLPEQPGRPVTTAGVRLPGWTGGQGFFLCDGETFVIAKPPKSMRTPQPWLPLVIRGRWVGDSWGSSWLQVDQLNEVHQETKKQGGGI
jgi:DNA polymerase III subunit alpha